VTTQTRHNLAPCESRLPLSEVGAAGRLSEVVPRYLALVDRPRSSRYPVELIAKRIERDRSVWGVIVDYGISYSHACRIRAGWRPR
jgi:hypothetical protein